MRSIDGFVIVGLLGQGGMSRVLKVRSPEDGRLLALKLLKPHPHLADLLGMEEIERRFRFEARVLAGINHPHVVRLVGARLSGPLCYMLLEYHCRTVSEWIGEGPRVTEASRPLRPNLALAAVRQTAQALRALHDKGLVHRDIKPANLLLAADRRVKLADFGLSKLRGERGLRPPQLMVGSPYYAAPEQEQDPEGVDLRADIYSLGVVLYRLIAGRLPEQPVDWNPILAEFGPNGQDLLERALAENPERRPAHAEEFLAELRRMEVFWQKHREAACHARWTLGALSETGETAPRRLRSEPIRTGPRKTGEFFPVNALWRPLAFTPRELKPSGDVVHDPATGLCWQRGGSPEPVPWERGRAYLDAINREGFAGRSCWRLPTAEELLSLLDFRAPLDDFCLPPVFERRQARLWSADRRTFLAAWIVDVESGYLGWQDFTCPAFVRAVCPEKGEGGFSGTPRSGEV